MNMHEYSLMERNYFSLSLTKCSQSALNHFVLDTLNKRPYHQDDTPILSRFKLDAMYKAWIETRHHTAPYKDWNPAPLPSAMKPSSRQAYSMLISVLTKKECELCVCSTR